MREWSGASTGVSGNDDWSNAANWVVNNPNLPGAPDGSAATLADLVFPAAASQRITNNDLKIVTGNQPTFNSITISATGYTLAGDALTLGSAEPAAR